MPRSAAIDLSKNPVQFTAEGSIEPVVQKGRAHPAVAGLLAGEARMTKSPPHGGEMHPDGDELLILVEGEIDVVLDEEDEQIVVPLTPGEAFVVPRGMWHRVIVKSPCRLLHFTPGRSQVRRRS
jgi:mannose-6-phosphate isomerase-like protein (cupin superfamily)